MLTHPTFDRLAAMGLHGMAKAFAELSDHQDADTLTHGEWLALLLEREASYRHDRRLAARLRYAHLRHMAAPEDVDWRAVRGLDRTLFAALLTGAWIDAADTVILTGPTDPDSCCTPRYLIENPGPIVADCQGADVARDVLQPPA